jgi:hypothetical protein
LEAQIKDLEIEISYLKKSEEELKKKLLLEEENV